MAKKQDEVDELEDRDLDLEVADMIKGDEPDDENQDPEHAREIKYEELDSFGMALAKHRAECIAARQSSNIEAIWIEDEEFYEGVDEANRSSEKRTDWHQKPPGQTPGGPKSNTQSSIFPNITAPFVDAATARLADVILPVGNQASWSFDPTPIPELIAKSKGDFEELPDIDYDDPAAVQAQAQNEDAEREEALRQIKAAKKLAERAETRIRDWHVECRRKIHLRKVIEDAGRIGVGVLKGPFNKVKTRVGYIDGKIEVINKVTPHSKWIDPWNLYPAKDCGDDIQNGDGVWERDYITMKQIREFLNDENYISEQILRCIEEGPQKAAAVYKETPEPIDDPNNREKFEIWYFHGTAEQEELEAGGCDCSGIEDPHMPAMITMINNHVVRASLNPLDTGQYPYSTFSWRRRSGHWAGIGVARQVRAAQKIVIGGARNLMNNAGLGAGPIIVFKQGAVTPADGVSNISPRKVYYLAEDDDSIQDATRAIGVIKIDMVVDDLIKIIQWGMRLAEDTTGLPMLLQGQMGSAPDTVGGMRILQNNTAPPLRRLARAFDNEITETEIERYYVYLLMYGEDDNEKGDFFVKANGSSTLVERDLQDQELGAMAGIVIDPRFKLDPAKWSEEYLKSRRFDPENFQMDEDGEEYQGMVQAAQQMQEMSADPRLQIAEMNLQAKGAEIQSKERMAMTSQQLNAELEVWRHEQEKLQLEANKQIELIIKQADDEASRSKIQADIAKVVMQLQADSALLTRKIASQEKLAGVKATSDRMPMKPPVEPLGRAPIGESIQK